MGEPRFKIRPDVACQEVDGEAFVVTPDNRLHNLRDPVAYALWRRLDQAPATLEELVAEVTANFDVEPDAARRDIEEFLEDGRDKRLIEQE